MHGVARFVLVVGVMAGFVAAGARPGLAQDQPAPPAGGVVADPSPSAVQHSVQSLIHSDKALQGQKVSSAVSDNGTVTLTGTVATVQQKDLASDIASQVKGVNAVDNKLTVAEAAHPTETAKQALRESGQEVSDSWLTTKIKSQLVTTGSGVSVSSENHVVTLSGTVSSAEERDKAVSIAKTTSGVVGVVDHIKVMPMAH
jgi:osmotically-inducible protein OsmY